jgi:hypothetical protein
MLRKIVLQHNEERDMLSGKAYQKRISAQQSDDYLASGLKN